jgi:hypothetical protein|tara:strand:+ start:88 stop:288 length:201 start_codon:yes stop_codon:yes gene_type:complete
MVNKTIETSKAINRFNDYLQCNYCDNEIEINDNYFILWSEKNYCDYVICNDICLDSAIEFIEKGVK